MSTPVTMPMPGDIDRNGVSRDVAAYVAAVRAQLDDLERDEIEELTGGLEADLIDELLNQQIEPGEMFGAPAEYAAELRSAAGLPPRRADRRRFTGGVSLSALPALVVRLREAGDQALASLIAQPWWPQVRDFLVALRPAWWLLRAYIAYQWIDQSLTEADRVLPYDVLTWSALAVLVIGSVETGRRDWAGRGRWQQTLVATGNVFAVLLLSYGSGGLGPEPEDHYHSTEDGQAPSEGLYNAGYRVVNVFPYDKDGRPLSHVQLFDDRGRAIAPAAERYTGENGERVRLIPAITADGRRGLNVYPLREQVIRPGYDPQTGEHLSRSSIGVLRNAALPDPSQAAVVPLPVPAASVTAEPAEAD